MIEGQIWGLVGRLPIGLILDQMDRKALARVETLLAAPLGRADRLAAYGVLALARLRQEAFPAARHAADTALAPPADHPPLSYYSLHALAGIAEVYLTLCDEGDLMGLPEERGNSWPAPGRPSQRRTASPVSSLSGAASLVAPGPVRLAGRAARSGPGRRGAALAAATHLAMPDEQGLAHYEIGRTPGRSRPPPAPDAGRRPVYSLGRGP